jgi:hypothetical protein
LSFSVEPPLSPHHRSLQRSPHRALREVHLRTCRAPQTRSRTCKDHSWQPRHWNPIARVTPRHALRVHAYPSMSRASPKAYFLPTSSQRSPAVCSAIRPSGCLRARTWGRSPIRGTSGSTRGQGAQGSRFAVANSILTRAGSCGRGSHREAMIRVPHSTRVGRTCCEEPKQSRCLARAGRQIRAARGRWR